MYTNDGIKVIDFQAVLCWTVGASTVSNPFSWIPRYGPMEQFYKGPKSFTACCMRPKPMNEIESIRLFIILQFDSFAFLKEKSDQALLLARSAASLFVISLPNILTRLKRPPDFTCGLVFWQKEIKMFTVHSAL